MRILVTGGGGYLGTVLVRQLLHHTVGAPRLRVLDRFSWGVQPLAAVYPRDARTDLLQVAVGDIRDPGAVREALHNIDAVIHLAGIVGYPACDADPQDADTTNVEGTRLLCSQLKGRPLIFASTGSCYGKVAGVATEDTPINPLTRYGRNKAQAEQLVVDAGGTCLRLATLYGISPRMRWDLLPHDFARRAVLEGALRVYEPEARRTFLHVEEAAAAFYHAITHHLRGIYNVGNPQQNFTKGALAQLVATITGCVLTRAEGHDADGRDYEVDFSKFLQEGWECYLHPWHGLHAMLPQLVGLARVWR